MSSQSPISIGLRTALPIDILDYAVTTRQARLRDGCTPQLTLEHQPSCSPAIIVRGLRRTIRFLNEGRVYREAVDVTIWCAILAELLGSALCPVEKRAGGIYPKPDEIESSDHDWAHVHRPLYLLRNVVFHPGVVRTHKKAREKGFVTHHEALCCWMERRGDSNLDREAAHAFRRMGPAGVQSELLARWAFERVELLGNYEIQRIKV